MEQRTRLIKEISSFALDKASVECLESSDEKVIKGGFLRGVLVEDGKLYFYKGVDLGDFLHDIAHLAITPKELRPWLDSECCFDVEEGVNYEKRFGQQFYYWSEQAAIAWTYFAWSALKENPFKQEKADIILEHYNNIAFSQTNGISDRFCYNLIRLKMLSPDMKTMLKWSYD